MELTQEQLVMYEELLADTPRGVIKRIIGKLEVPVDLNIEDQRKWFVPQYEYPLGGGKFITTRIVLERGISVKDLIKRFLDILSQCIELEKIQSITLTQEGKLITMDYMLYTRKVLEITLEDILLGIIEEPSIKLGWPFDITVEIKEESPNI